MLLTLAIQGAEHAGEAAEHAAQGAQAAGPMEFQFVTYISSIVVFAIAFILLGILVWPKITKGLDERNQKILDEIKAAEEARAQAKRALAEYEQELANARQEANRMIQEAREDAKRTGEELRKRNEEELSQLRARAQRDIQAAKESAITELHGEAATLATSIASRILQREISVEDQQRLVDESLGRLKAVQSS